MVLGGSYTMGWAIPDEDTFVWKLQRAFPSFLWLNYGTGAYGTYQSLLRLKRHLRTAKRPPARVLYGFMGNHDMRNVGDPRWMAMLSRLSRRGHVEVPYCRLKADKSLRCYPPERYPLSFLDRWSSAIMLARGLYYKSRAKTWDRQKTAVTLKLMEEMNALSRENGADFAVVFLALDSGRRNFYAQTLKRSGISYIDCVDPHMYRPGYTVPGEGYPNGAMNKLWAKCIGKRLRSL